MAKPRPWDEKWVRGERLASGGHGHAFLATRIGDTDAKFVIKVLKNQADPERRERMHREVMALGELDHPCIPKVVDTNATEYEDPSAELFFACDFVDGLTLDEQVKNSGPLSIDDALQMTLSIARTLAYCHIRGILHRDVKPDNIILRSADGQPVVIDFGQSFNAEDEASCGLTPTGQQLGNRFLHLPELQTGDSTKRHPESDISQCAGVLFYGLTGIPPEHLVDHEGRKPHERARAAEMLGAAPVSLLRLFDRGFEHQIANRYRSFGAFEGSLHEVIDELRTGVPALAASIPRAEAADPVEALKTFVEARNKGRINELLIRELDAFDSALQALGLDHAAAFSPEALAERLEVYERISAPLCRLAATGADWWLPGCERSWIEFFESLADLPIVSPVNPYWGPLRRYPALLCMYAAGVTACDRGHFEVLKTVLCDALFELNLGLGRDPVVALLRNDRVFYSNASNQIPGLEKARTPVSEYLFKVIRAPLQNVIRRDAAYDAAFDMFEYLGSLVYADHYARTWDNYWGPPGRFFWKLRAGGDNHVVVRVNEEASRLIQNWPPLRAGLFDGSHERFETVRSGNLERLAKAVNGSYFS